MQVMVLVLVVLITAGGGGIFQSWTTMAFTLVGLGTLHLAPSAHMGVAVPVQCCICYTDSLWWGIPSLPGPGAFTNAALLVCFFQLLHGWQMHCVDSCIGAWDNTPPIIPSDFLSQHSWAWRIFLGFYDGVFGDYHFLDEYLGCCQHRSTSGCLQTVLTISHCVWLSLDKKYFVCCVCKVLWLLLLLLLLVVLAMHTAITGKVPQIIPHLNIFS